MNIDQTVCSICTKIYSQKNPPRLLPMCGHTYCDYCIKKLITKKKFNHKFKITCPNDSHQIELNSSSTSGFPINLSLMNLVKSKIQISAIRQESNNVSRDDLSSKLSPQNSSKNISLLYDDNNKILAQLTSDQQLENMNFNICLLHQKPLQIVCLKDCKRICASCVIFGQHRGHKVRDYKQVSQILEKDKKRLEEIKNKYISAFEKMGQEKVKQNLQQIINRKRKQIESTINTYYKQLSQMLKESQNKTLLKTQKLIKSLKIKSQQMLLQRINEQDMFCDWENSLKAKLNILQGNSEQQKFKFVLRDQNFMENCQKTLQQIQNSLPNLIKELQLKCQSLSLIYDRKQAQHSFQELFKVQSCENSFLDINESRISFVKVQKQQSLLDDIDTSQLSLMMKSVQCTQTFRNNMSQTVHHNINDYNKLKKVENASINLTRLKSTQSRHNIRHYKSPSINQQVSSKNIIGVKTPLAKSRTKIFRNIPEKYEKNIDQVISGFSDVLDLTGAQLGDDHLLNILRSVKSSPLTIMKLVKNKLTDSGFDKIEDFIENAVMLNLSKNELTSKTLQKLVNNKSDGRFKNLKSVMLGQNKIQERKCKVQVEKLRKMGVNVCL